MFSLTAPNSPSTAKVLYRAASLLTESRNVDF